VTILQTIEKIESSKIRVLAIGDGCIDEYCYGVVNRISPEAPVPILDYTRKEIKDGMVLNVENNIRSLGGDCYTIQKTTQKKIRFIDEKTNRQLMRLDLKIEPDNTTSKDLIFNENFKDFNLIVISDYDKGFLDYETIVKIIEFANAKGIPVFLDTKKKDLRFFKGAFVKINELEFLSAISLTDNLIVTRGEKSVKFKEKNFPVNSTKVIDVCGAGDTFLAGIAVAYAATKDIEKSIEFAIAASSIVINKIGTYSPSLNEIKKVMQKC
jgi:bifunctional ADP-heptose synthase (sugar kinase/adenylyltransferase)